MPSPVSACISMPKGQVVPNDLLTQLGRTSIGSTILGNRPQPTAFTDACSRGRATFLTR